MTGEQGGRANGNIDAQDQLVGPSGFVNSIIGEGTRFSGEFDPEGLLRIDGDFQGKVRTKGRVLVGRNGRAECSIDAATVVIGGAFRGDIRASEKVIVLSTGLVLGSIRTPRLVVEEGVLFNGTCSVEPGVARDDADPLRHSGTTAPATPPSHAGERDFRVVTRDENTDPPSSDAQGS